MSRSKSRVEWKKIEVERKPNIEDQPPSIVFKLPSGFQNREIRVYEDTEGNLDTWYVYKKDQKPSF